MYEVEGDGGRDPGDCAAGGGGALDGTADERRLEAAGLSWPLPADMTDSALEQRLFTSAGTKAATGGMRNRIGRRRIAI